jgi:hypothetical protein
VGSLSIISWRDIPAQVVVKRGREHAKVQLSARFQEAVDRAAMRAGRGSSAAEAARIEQRYSDHDLERLIRAKGLERADGDPDPASGGN